MRTLTQSCIEYLEKYAEQKYPLNLQTEDYVTECKPARWVDYAKEVLTNDQIINLAGLHTHTDVIDRLFKNEETVESKYSELEKHVLELLSLTGKKNIIEVIEMFKNDNH